jgi:PHP family Zn ribbon phosphoesterase
MPESHDIDVAIQRDLERISAIQTKVLNTMRDAEAELLAIRAGHGAKTAHLATLDERIAALNAEHQRLAEPLAHLQRLKTLAAS